MFIRDLLKKYKNFEIVDKKLKSFLILKFRNDFNYNLEFNKIRRQGKIIYLDVNPIIKSEILINKKNLLNLIKEFDSNITDLR